MPEEKVVDLFAVYYTSQETALKDFNWLIKRRREMVGDPQVNAHAVAELCKRKRFIRELDCSDENSRHLVCEFCGQANFEQL